MASERTDRLFEMGREAGEKYDYFMTGLAAALTAYLGENFEPSFSPLAMADVIEAVAILVLIGSVASGIKRISVTNHVLRVGQAKIETIDRIETIQQAIGNPQAVVRIRGLGNLSPSQLQDLLPDLERMRAESQDLQTKLMKRAALSAQLRDLLLLVGFLTLVIARLVGGFST